MERFGERCGWGGERRRAEQPGGGAGEVSNGGLDGSGDEDPWPDDGPRHQYAHCGAEGCAGAGDSADLGGRLRGECDRVGNRKRADTSTEEVRTTQKSFRWAGQGSAEGGPPRS